MKNKIEISSNFDSGNIKVINCNSVNNIELEINKDNNSDFFQWFYFRVNSTKRTSHKLRILNADSSAYVPGWTDYKAVCSYDRKEWFRVETNFNGKELEITHTPKQDTFYLAYFTPYSHERHLDLIAQSQSLENCTHRSIGKSFDNKDIDLLKIGSDPSKLNVWMIARQHPGETMAQWFVEGFLKRLQDSNDSLTSKVLSQANFFIIPNMNPDGAFRGHLRTNTKGVNLNREWESPSLDSGPEVYYTRNEMDKTGVDLFLDIHGDENLPYNFVAGSEGNSTYNEHIKVQEEIFKNSFLDATDEFQTKFGYDLDRPGEANMTVATNAIAHRFNCLSYTLEMPFKDNKNLPSEKYGWSAKRSQKLGEDILVPISEVLEHLIKNK
jgi:murein tripeptide amidase MpaA